MKELTPQERDLRSRTATIVNLERAGQPSYDGTQATSAATSASWASWLNKAGNDPIKAQRLKTAALLRGRMEAQKRRGRK